MHHAYRFLLIVFFIIPIVLKAQTITTIAGTGTPGTTGDGGPATLAKLFVPNGLLHDPAGNTYISEYGRIRRIDPAGIITTFAGNGILGYSGDGGPATAAGIATGYLCYFGGNIYLSECDSSRVRKIDAAGIITTVIGTGVPGYNGDGIAASVAQINEARAIAADGAGNLYIADGANSRIRKINTVGIISTIAGTGIPGHTGDGGPATAAKIKLPWAIATDIHGNVFISDSNIVRKIDAVGTITRFAGPGAVGIPGDNGPATAAYIGISLSIKADRRGNIYFNGDGRVRKVDVTGIISTVAGTGIVGYSGDGGPATAATFNQIYDIDLDCAEDLYIATRVNAVVRQVAYNHAPVLTNGHTYSLRMCLGAGGKSYSNMLKVYDADTMQNAEWSVVRTPVHGTATGYGMATTGDTIIPTGLTYTPTPGYMGYDTFTVVISDCKKTDTATIYVSVDTVLKSITPITGMDSVCKGSTILLANATTGGTWSSSNTTASVTAGVVTGLKPGKDTVIYTLTNGCGSYDTFFALRVVQCISGIAQAGTGSGGLSIWPNPAHGTMTVNIAGATAQPAIITVTNIIGTTIATIHTTTNTDTAVELKTAPGIYVLSAATAGSRYVQRVVVE